VLLRAHLVAQHSKRSKSAVVSFYSMCLLKCPAFAVSPLNVPSTLRLTLYISKKWLVESTADHF
jgi:hypothetical protein